jgi:hypothetical protein
MKVAPGASLFKSSGECFRFRNSVSAKGAFICGLTPPTFTTSMSRNQFERLTEAGQTDQQETARPDLLINLPKEIIMNRNIASALIVAAAALAGTAYADDITVDNTVFQSSKTRAEVVAELAQYKKAGVNVWSTQYNPLKSFASARSAADVRAEYIASRNEVNAFTGEDSGSAYLQASSGRAFNTSTTLAGTPVNAQ